MERLLTANEVGTSLGYTRTSGAIVEWAERGQLPHFKVGGRLQFRESEVLAWLSTAGVLLEDLMDVGA